jgi:multidrug transporter EmrE-like cation transporter
MLQWKRDVICSVGFLIFCIINYIYAGFMPKGTIKVPLAQPNSYLKLWLVALAILAIVVLVRALKNKPKDVMVPIWSKLSIFTVVTVGVYLLLMPYLGFFISTFLFLVATITVYSLNMGKEKKTGKAFIIQMTFYTVFSLVTAIIVEQIFRNGLDVILPKFSLF